MTSLDFGIVSGCGGRAVDIDSTIMAIIILANNHHRFRTFTRSFLASFGTSHSLAPGETIDHSTLFTSEDRR